MSTDKTKKISLGKTRFILNQLEDFAGPGKPRGCEICRRGDGDVVQVAREQGYRAAVVAEFLIATRKYPETLNRDAVYRHWHRCPAKKNRQEEKITQSKG